MVENAPKIKNVQLFSWELCFFCILQTLVLLDHVYSDCLQNVATNTKTKPFSDFGPRPITHDNTEGRRFLYVADNKTE